MRCPRFLLMAFLLVAAPRLLAGDAVKWRPIAAGEAEARKSGKPVLYFMTAEWCGPCKTMRTEVFADPKVASLVNATFVPIEVVDRRREEGKNLPDAERVFRLYRCQGFPTLTVTRPDSLDAFQLPGWLSKEATVSYLQVAKGKLEAQEKARHAEGAKK